MVAAIDPGERDQRIVVKARADVDDGGGGVSHEWVETGRLWAHVKPVRATESERQGGMRDGVVYLMTVDARSAAAVGLVPAAIVVWAGQNLNVREVRTAPASQHDLEIVAESNVTL